MSAPRQPRTPSVADAVDDLDWDDAVPPPDLRDHLGPLRDALWTYDLTGEAVELVSAVRDLLDGRWP